MADYKFKPGDEVIWLKPVKVKLEKSGDKDKVKGKVIEDPIRSGEGEWWHFYADSGIWCCGEIETRGILVHPGFAVESGPEPKRKPDYKFKDREFVLVRDDKNERWKLAAFKKYDCAVHPLHWERIQNGRNNRRLTFNGAAGETWRL